MTSNIIEKFEKYWKHDNEILVMTTILDLKYKIKLIELYFPLMYGDESQIHIESAPRFARI